MISNGAWYYLQPETGYMQTGWFRDETYNSWFCAAPSGRIISNCWIYWHGSRYFLQPGGYMAEEGIYYDGTGWFYADETGAAVENGTVTDEDGTVYEVVDWYIPDYTPGQV